LKKASSTQADDLALSVSGFHCLTDFVEHHPGAFEANIELARQGQGDQAMYHDKGIDNIALMP